MGTLRRRLYSLLGGDMSQYKLLNSQTKSTTAYDNVTFTASVDATEFIIYLTAEDELSYQNVTVYGLNAKLFTVVYSSGNGATNCYSGHFIKADDNSLFMLCSSKLNIEGGGNAFGVSYKKLGIVSSSTISIVVQQSSSYSVTSEIYGR